MNDIELKTYFQENNDLLKTLINKVNLLVEENNITKKRTKKTKDPNAPKGARGPWILFSSMNKNKYQKKYPDSSYQEIVKKMSTDWKNLSSTKKAKYTELAKKDKLRYENEMAQYNKKHNLEKSQEVKPKRVSKSKARPIESEESSEQYSLDELELSE
jgi:ADP-heptose:LPS heptosyltransferase